MTVALNYYIGDLECLILKRCLPTCQNFCRGCRTCSQCEAAAVFALGLPRSRRILPLEESLHRKQSLTLFFCCHFFFAPKFPTDVRDLLSTQWKQTFSLHLLIKRAASSEQHRLQQLFTVEELGDRESQHNFSDKCNSS